MYTREQEYRDVRRLLGDPKESAPSPDMIVSQLFREEQKMLNALGQTAKGWTTDSLTITTVANQAEYEITTQGYGKTLFVFQDMGNNVIRQIPHADYQSELANQKYDFTIIPALAGTTPGFYGEKISFFRAGAGGTPMARIYPIPETADIDYTVIFARGALDWESADWGDTPILPEWSHLRTIRAALFLVARTEWEGMTRAETLDQRKQIATSLLSEKQEEQPEFDAFIRNPQYSPSEDSGYWYE